MCVTSLKDIGNYGEKVTRMRYEQYGYVFYDAHVTSRFAEIDLIMLKEMSVTFIEVKTRINALPYSPYRSVFKPEHSVIKTKQKKIRRLAENYLCKHPFLYDSIETIHIDIASVIIIKEPFSVTIKVINDAF